MALRGPAGPTSPFEEESFRRLSVRAGTAIFQANRHGEIVSANDGWHRLCGSSPDAALDAHWLKTVHPEDLSRVSAAWQRAVIDGTSVDLRFRFADDRGTRHVHLSAAPLRNDVGSVEGFAGIAAEAGDVTLAESMPLLVWTSAPDGTVEYFNRGWLDYTGASVESVRANAHDVVHPDDLAQTQQRWKQALANGEPFENEYRLKRKRDGTYRWFLARAVPLRGEAGRVLRWVGTATDIDEPKRAADNLRFVLDASASLTASLDVDAICARLAEISVDRFADWCFVVLLDERGGRRLAAVGHRDGERSAQIRRLAELYPITDDSPFDRAIHENVSILIESVDPELLRGAARDERHLALLEGLHMRSVMVVPIASDGRTHGGIALVSSESARTFGAADLEVAEMVARRAGSAISTARVFDEERRTIARLRFIARASTLLFETADLQTMFDDLTQFIVSDMADFAVVMVIEGDSAVRTISTAHHDPAKSAIAARFRGERTMRTEAEEQAVRVLAQHRPLLYPSVSIENVLPVMWDYLAPEVRALDVRSALTIPLYSRGETYGALVAYWCESGRNYNEDDLPVFSDLGKRLSIAIDHARTLERERRISEALQTALLPVPESLPHRPELEFTWEYRASAQGAEVGGDWYDAFELDDGSIVVSVGDVTGRGLSAAGIMGKLRQALGVVTMYERDPARILDAMDAHLRRRRNSAIATAFVGIIDPQRRTLRYAGAGHPPPMLRRNGELVVLSGDGLPLGLRNDYREESREASLEGAEAVVLYTDGLTESTRDVIVGERRLREVASTNALLYVRNAARFLCDACLPLDIEDDTAVLAVRFGARTQWHFDAENARAAHDARDQFIAYLRAEARPDGDFDAAELIFGELIGNVVRHAPGPIDVAIEWAGERPVLHVIDRGKGFVREPALPEPMSECGRGLFIVSRLGHRLRVERIPGYGNHVCAELDLVRAN